MRKLIKKNIELKDIQSLHVAKINVLRKEYADKVEMLRKEMLKKEEERTHQWMESEKETLTILNSLSEILELNETVCGIDSKKIMDKLDEIKMLIKNKNEKNGENRKT